MRILIIFLCTIYLTTSCSSNDDEQIAANTNHFPLTNNNSWKYKVTVEDENEEDELKIDGTIVINNKTYHKMKANEPFFGFYSSSMNNNGVRQETGKIYLQGNFEPSDDLPINLDIVLNDFVVLDANANAGVQLDILSGSFSQDLGDIPLTINYQLISESDGKLDSFTTTENETFQDIIKTKIILKLNISTTQEIIPGFPPVTVQILPMQNVLVSTQYYANNVGMIYNNTNIQYQLNQALSQFELPISDSFSQNQKEVLINYIINN